MDYELTLFLHVLDEVLLGSELPNQFAREVHSGVSLSLFYHVAVNEVW